MNIRIVLPAAVLAAAAALSGAAQASVVLDSVTSDGADFKFSYSGTLTSETGLRGGTKVVVLDFSGYVPGSISSTEPFVTTSVRNKLPNRILAAEPGVTDNPDVPDLVFTFRGPTFKLAGGQRLDTFSFAGLSADSIFGATVSGMGASLVNNVGSNRTISFNPVGVPGGPVVSNAPEPAAWLLMLAGLFGTGMVLRRNRNGRLVPV